MTAADLITRARAALIVSQPFFGSLALGLTLAEDASVETMATNGRRLAYAPDYVARLTPSELQGVIAHEVMHLACLHHVRKGARDDARWNKACDFAINRDLVAAGFRLPKDALIDPRFDGIGAEDIYRALAKEDEQSSNGGKSAPGAPGRDPGQCGGVEPAAPAHDEAALTASGDDWRARVAQSLAVAKAQGAGTLPAHLARVAEEVAAARVDWRGELRRFIDQSSVRDYSWSRPNRRHVGRGLILPGFVSDSLSHLVVIVDTSGSIDQTALAAFRAELAAALDEGAADRVTVAYCDTRVHRSDEFERGDRLSMNAKGGGGTRFAPAFEWINANAPDASAVLYFTDLDCSDYGAAPSSPVLWAAWGDPRKLATRTPPFGDVVRVTD